MYYPYLRAKQYELKALREFSVEHKEQKSIVPILEPVKQQPNALNLGIDEMLTNGLKFALILNPKDGDFKHPTVQFDTWFQNEKLMENKTSWIPAFLYSKRNAHEISSIIDKYTLGNVMIIFRTCMDMDDESAWKIINDEAVGYIICSENYDNYEKLFTELYLNQCAALGPNRYIEAKLDLLSHSMFRNEHPAHFHIDIYDDYQRMGLGSLLISTLKSHLRKKNIKSMYKGHGFITSN